MKKLLFLTLAAIFIFNAAAAHAQFGNLKKIVKDKAESEKAKTNDTKTAENNTNETAVGKSEARSASVKPSKDIEFDSEYPPGIMFSTLLDAMRILPGNQLAINTVTATFLPPASNPGDYYPYGLTGGGKLEGIIKRKDGSIVDRRRWSGENKRPPIWLISPADNYENIAPGEYVLEMRVEDKLFYRFPFSVANEKGVDDPFARGAQDEIVLKGAWNDYAYFYVEQGNMDWSLKFYIWMRQPFRKTVTTKIELFRNGKLYAGSGGADGHKKELVSYWRKDVYGLSKPGGMTLNGKDLITKDGDYKLIVYVDNKVYGEYPFSVAGGKFVYLPEQTRGKEDMTTFVEGSNDSFFIRKSGSRL